ncbi:MAG TPA: hypothetical protein VLY20_10515 [Nitrospiria bacterium]|nr:hypothetical protein [Nitrospiria bacterium]
MATPSSYLITIFFREPDYELRVGAKPEPYSVSYRLQAASKEDAERLALDEFRRQASASHVSWTRVVEKVESRPVGPDENQP